MVRFTDYGNEDVVTDEHIVMDIKMIPVADVIDEVMDGDCGGPKKGIKFASFDHHGRIFTALLL